MPSITPPIASVTLAANAHIDYDSVLISAPVTAPNAWVGGHGVAWFIIAAPSQASAYDAYFTTTCARAVDAYEDIENEIIRQGSASLYIDTDLSDLIARCETALTLMQSPVTPSAASTLSVMIPALLSDAQSIQAYSSIESGQRQLSDSVIANQISGLTISANSALSEVVDHRVTNPQKVLAILLVCNLETTTGTNTDRNTGSASWTVKHAAAIVTLTQYLSEMAAFQPISVDDDYTAQLSATQSAIDATSATLTTMAATTAAATSSHNDSIDTIIAGFNALNGYDEIDAPTAYIGIGRRIDSELDIKPKPVENPEIEFVPGPEVFDVDPPEEPDPIDPVTGDTIATPSPSGGNEPVDIESTTGIDTSAIPILDSLFPGVQYEVARGNSLIYQRNLAALQIQMLEARKAILQSLPDDATRAAWCADLTTDLSAGTIVGTIENNDEYEQSKINIRPGYGSCEYNAARDGQIASLLTGTPAHTFYNLAMLPALQKWIPHYRIGTITNINTGANTATVIMDAAVSSQQSIDINQAATLTGIPVEYMQCDASAFEDGDRVIVEFTQGDAGSGTWNTAKVIGFESHPKPCETDIFVEIRLDDKTEYAPIASMPHVTYPNYKYVIYNCTKGEIVELIHPVSEDIVEQPVSSEDIYNWEWTYYPPDDTHENNYKVTWSDLKAYNGVEGISGDVFHLTDIDHNQSRDGGIDIIQDNYSEDSSEMLCNYLECEYSGGPYVQHNCRSYEMCIDEEEYTEDYDTTVESRYTRHPYETGFIYENGLQLFERSDTYRYLQQSNFVGYSFNSAVCGDLSYPVNPYGDLSIRTVDISVSIIHEDNIEAIAYHPSHNIAIAQPFYLSKQTTQTIDYSAYDEDPSGSIYSNWTVTSDINDYTEDYVFINSSGEEGFRFDLAGSEYPGGSTGCGVDGDSWAGNGCALFYERAQFVVIHEQIISAKCYFSIRFHGQNIADGDFDYGHDYLERIDYDDIPGLFGYTKEAIEQMIIDNNSNTYPFEVERVYFPEY